MTSMLLPILEARWMQKECDILPGASHCVAPRTWTFRSLLEGDDVFPGSRQIASRVAWAELWLSWSAVRNCCKNIHAYDTQPAWL